MFILKKLADEDTSHNKVDLGVGIYRNNEGHYSELNAVAQVVLTMPIGSIFTEELTWAILRLN